MLLLSLFLLIDFLTDALTDLGKCPFPFFQLKVCYLLIAIWLVNISTWGCLFFITSSKYVYRWRHNYKHYWNTFLLFFDYILTEKKCQGSSTCFLALKHFYLLYVFVSALSHYPFKSYFCCLVVSVLPLFHDLMLRFYTKISWRAATDCLLWSYRLSSLSCKSVKSSGALMIYTKCKSGQSL